MTSRGGEYLARAVLVVSATLLGLLTIEGAVRVWIAATTPTLLVLDPELGWADHANVRRIERSEGVEALVETNALGLRGPLHAGPSEGHRILILGDSFAEGRQVSNHELFSVLVERAHPRLELVNTGVIGYGTVQEALALKRWEPLVHPELVVLLVFRNDLGDNLSPFSPPIGPRPYADRSAAFRPLDWRLYAPFLPSIPGRAWLRRRLSRHPLERARSEDGRRVSCAGAASFGDLASP